MNTVCNNAMENIGESVGAALTAVDCASTQLTASAFKNLFAEGGALELALVILLTLYVAFFGFSLILGRSNLSVRALLPRIIMIGFVLAFATSWIAFQSVVWNLFVATPDYLASILTGSEGSATLAFAAKLDVVFMAVQEASASQEDISAFSPPGMMWLGALLLILGTVGVLVAARIGLALLVALGPIFVVLAIFSGTRGLFTGWIKGMTMLALTPLIAVVGGSLMLELSVPILSSLTEVPGQINPQAAMAFFLLGAVHVALMLMAFKVSSTMVAGWRVFGLVPSKDGAEATLDTRPTRQSDAPRQAALSSQQATTGSSRRIEVAGAAGISPANDTGPATTRVRQTKAYAGASAKDGIGANQPPVSRTRGIGSKFRSANLRAAPHPSEANS
mgnify:CR=1 FL=1